MKSFFYTLSLVLLVSLFGCQESEEPFQSPLSGTWENREFDEAAGLWFVEVLTFKNDTLMEVQKIVRETETGETLGYRMIADSWYNLEGSTFKYYYSYALINFGGASDSEEKPYGTKEELKPGVVDFFRVPTGTLTFFENGNRFRF